MTDTDTQTGSKPYEISAIGVDESVVDHVRAALKTAGATIDEEGKVVSIRLAYPIRKQTSGFFVCVKFSTLPRTIVSLEKELMLNPHILRLLIVTPPPARAIEHERRSATRPSAPQKGDARETASLTNEALEQKIEEILK